MYLVISSDLTIKEQIKFYVDEHKIMHMGEENTAINLIYKMMVSELIVTPQESYLCR